LSPVPFLAAKSERAGLRIWIEKFGGRRMIWALPDKLEEASVVV
jgi:hypothetical protein